jgi:pyruvate kinase
MAMETDVELLRYRRTKIVATLGPASSDDEVIAQLVKAGVSMFRLNMSHGGHDGHRANYERVRAAAAAAGSPIPILADLCGPKIRVGTFRGGSIPLVAGEPVTVTVRDVEGEPGLVPSCYAALASDVRAGNRILLADGVMELRVDRVEGTEIACTVVEGGTLSNRKGMNLPGVAVSAPCLTDKDKADVRFALALGVDYLALSFVRQASDVVELRELVRELGGDVGIIAKIERPEGLENAASILGVADGVMVARGDMGVELPPERVPVAQRFLVDLARTRGKPVIVATQMLESMVENARPTRAEVTDVSAAVSSGADAVMLSAESASGAHPVGAVSMMDRIARQTEGYQFGHGRFGSIVPGEPGDGGRPLSPADAVARATAQLSRDLRVRAIFVATRSGRSAAEVSAARPAAPIVAVTASERTGRRINLLWGVLPVVATEQEVLDLPRTARRLALEMGLASPGQYVLAVRGYAPNPSESMPTVMVLAV